MERRFEFLQESKEVLNAFTASHVWFTVKWNLYLPFLSELLLIPFLHINAGCKERKKHLPPFSICSRYYNRQLSPAVLIGHVFVL